MLTVLHIVDRLSAAGPTRSMIGLVKHLSRLGVEHGHRVVALHRDAYPLALIQAKRAGMTVVRRPDADELNDAWIDVPERYRPEETDVCDSGAYW